MATYRDEQGNIISRKSPVSGNGKQTEAQKRAKKKYMDKTYKNLAIHTRPENVQLIDNYCQSIGMSKASTIVNAIKYCVANNINLKEWASNTTSPDDTE